MVNEGGVLVCLVGLLVSEVAGRGVSLEMRHNGFGWTIISAILVVIGFNLVIGVVELYNYIKENCTKNKAVKPPVV